MSANLQEHLQGHLTPRQCEVVSWLAPFEGRFSAGVLPKYAAALSASGAGISVTSEDFVKAIDALVAGCFATRVGCIARFITLQGELPPLMAMAVDAQGQTELCERAHASAYQAYVDSMKGLMLSEDPVDHRIGLSTLNGDVTNLKRALLKGARSGLETDLLQRVVRDCLIADRREGDYKILQRQLAAASR